MKSTAIYARRLTSSVPTDKHRSINTLAETNNGLFKAEVIHRRGPSRSFNAVEYSTLEWVDWFNNRRLLEPISNIPPAEAEANFYAALETSDVAAQLRSISLRQTRRGSEAQKSLKTGRSITIHTDLIHRSVGWLRLSMQHSNVASGCFARTPQWLRSTGFELEPICRNKCEPTLYLREPCHLAFTGAARKRPLVWEALERLYYFRTMVAGTGFEPVTFRL